PSNCANWDCQHDAPTRPRPVDLSGLWGENGSRQGWPGGRPASTTTDWKDTEPMQVSSWTSRASVLALAATMALIAGCAEQSSSHPQAEKSGATESPAQQAAAEPQQRPAAEEQAAAPAHSSPIADDQVQPATAVAPTPAVDATVKPAELPT